MSATPPGDRGALCGLFAAIALAADPDASHAAWDARDPDYARDVYEEWLSGLFDDYRLEAFADMERGYLGLSARVPAALRAFVVAIAAADSLLECGVIGDVRALLGCDEWLAVVLAARVVTGLTADWRAANCA